jgi:hypothetical protein
MNATELIDKLNKYNKDGMPVLVISQAVDMLRQQQAQIETMKNPIMQAIAQAFDPAKTLTDKEIKNIWCEVYNFKDYDCLTELDYKFCREIIKKAQEK